MRQEEKPKDLWTDEEFVRAYGEAAKRRRWPVRAGRIRRAGWSAPMDIYVIWCEACARRPGQSGFTVTYGAGHDRRLACDGCKERFEHRLPSRVLKDALLNPHRHPRFLAFLFLIVILAALSR